MKNSTVLLGIGIVLACSSLSQAQTAQVPAGFTAVFNGKDLQGWHAIPHFDHRKLAAMPEAERTTQLDSWMKEARQHWTVDNGELVNDGKGPYLTTDADYGDIELLLEYKTVAKADSGIYLRGTPQVQIWDYTKAGGKWNRGADRGSGGLFNNTTGHPGRLPLVLADQPFKKWNQYRIVQIGETTSVWLNGKLVVDRQPMHNYWDRTRPLFSQGPIQLQTHGGEIRWRNIFIRKLDAAAANQMLANQDSQFTPVFNGKNLDGWIGDVGNYEVKDGAILCKQGQGGNLLVKDQLEDFVVRLEFKLPPAGNNGLAIRFSGKGQPHVNGMCELQVLDSEHPKYASLHPSQYHGSAYGLVPAHRGYLRPTGEWNYQQVTVRGSTIQVDLNGTRILDADLSQLSESKDGKLHEAITARKGYFGFAGHNDPVAFRNIRIKRLPTQPVSEAVTQWPQFRGLGSRGVSQWNTGLPTDIGPDKKAAWKIPLPPGHSSPVIYGDHIFLAAEDNDQLFTMALDRSTGKVLWKQEAKYNKLESIHSIGSHVQTTPATDGKHVVSLFGSTGMFCYDLAGKLLWNKPMGPFNNSFGAGSSPLIVDGQVILCQDHDTGSFLESIDVATGKTTWKIDRSEFPRNYGTPVIWEVNGNKQIVVAATLRVVGYDFRSGEELWTVRGVSRVVCTTPVIGEDNHLYVASWARGGDIDERISVDPFKVVLAKVDANNNGTIERNELEKGGAVERRYEQVDRDKTKTLTEKEWEYYRGVFDAARNGVLKIRPGGTGDITKSHVEWEFRKFLPFCSSPLVYNGYVFTVKDGGIVTCLDAATGKALQTKRISGTGSYYSSAVAGDGKIYFFDQRGKMTIISPWVEWKELAKADFKEEIYATPAIADGRIYIRTAGHLYCFD